MAVRNGFFGGGAVAQKVTAPQLPKKLGNPRHCLLSSVREGSPTAVLRIKGAVDVVALRVVLQLLGPSA
jgi:hypothetical protein